MSEQYETGVKLTQEKVDAIRNIFNSLSLSFDDYNVHCLRDAVRKDIPHFLMRYDIRFCPQDTVITLDYPVLSDCRSLSGASAVLSYLDAIRTEQQFLNAFPRDHVLSILERHDCEYPYMTENLRKIVLTSTVGHIAIQKPLQDTGFREEEYLRLSELFSAFSAYLRLAVENIATHIQTAALHGHLNRIFLL